MTFTITARGVGSFAATADETLLEAGLRAGFSFPHACRNGNCERCLATLESGQVIYSGRQGTRLRERHGSNALLCCQARPTSDCTFHMNGLQPPGVLPQFEKTCQKIDLTPLNHDVSLLRLRLPAGSAITWHAGQYLKLLVGERWLPFSIANAPQPGERELEIHFRHLGHHSSAQQHLAWITQHDLLRVHLPFGHSFIETPPQRPLWFICGSTGFAQAQAMLQHLAHQGFTGELRLFWGNRTRVDVYLPEAPARLAIRLPGLAYELLLSDEDSLGFQRGFAHERALANLKEPINPLFFVSGSPAMVEATDHALRQAGVGNEQILSDMLFPHAIIDHPATL